MSSLQKSSADAEEVKAHSEAAFTEVAYRVLFLFCSIYVFKMLIWVGPLVYDMLITFSQLYSEDQETFWFRVFASVVLMLTPPVIGLWIFSPFLKKKTEG